MSEIPWSQNIGQLSVNFVGELDKTILDGLVTRKKNAVDALLVSVSQQRENSTIILEYLPDALLVKSGILATLYFLETQIRNWVLYSSDSIEWILEQAIHEIELYDKFENHELSELILNFLRNFTQVLAESDWYKENPKYFILVWYIEEKKGRYKDAIDAYKRAIELNFPDGYIMLGSFYMNQTNYVEAVRVYEAGYDLFKTTSFLSCLITALYKSNRKEDAFKLYQKLASTRNWINTISPFLIYKDAIETDDDLKSLEVLVTLYRNEGTFLFNDDLKKASDQACEYITNEIDKENCVLDSLGSITLEKWIKEDVEWSKEKEEIVKKSAMRRLFLMQVDIITLQNPRYVEEYIGDLEKYGIVWNDARP